MTPLHVTNTGASPEKIVLSANPGDALAVLKISPVTIAPGQSASIPLTLAVPKVAATGQSYVILTAGRTNFDVRFSVGVPPPRQCVAAGYKPLPASRSPWLLWLLLIVLLVLAALWIRRRLAVRRKAS
jgi:hypothetical protein